MQTSNIIHTVSCHAEGEVGDVIVGGVAPPPGETLWEQSRWIARVGNLRAIVPSISGRAWITGTHQHRLDPTDPWPQGYKIADTWPKRR